MFWRQVAFLDRVDLVLGLAQIEEQLLLVRGRAKFHQAPRTQDVFLDGGTDPPHRVGGKTKALVRFEALNGLHETDIALRDNLRHRQTIAAIAHRDLGDETKMASDELARRAWVFMLFPP